MRCLHCGDTIKGNCYKSDFYWRKMLKGFFCLFFFLPTGTITWIILKRQDQRVFDVAVSCIAPACRNLVPAVCHNAAHSQQIKGLGPLRPPVFPHPASRWALLMSPSFNSREGLFFPGLAGAKEGAEGGLLAGSVPGRGPGDWTRLRYTRVRAKRK